MVRHLEFFVAVADELHFGRAADAVGVSQPPLSQGVRRLEERLGSVLLERSSRGVTLTPAGVALLPHARRVLAEVQQLLAAAADARDDVGSVRIGVPPQLPLPAVATLVAAVRDAVAGRRVDVVTAPTVALLSATTASELSAAVVVHPAPVAGLCAGTVVRLRGSLLVSADHALAQSYSSPVTLPELARTLALALPPRRHPPAAYDSLRDLLERHRIRISARTAEDDRAATVAAVSGAAAFTADPGLSSPFVANLDLADDPVPLRLRIVRPATDDQSTELAVVDALQAALESFAAGARR